MKIIVLIVSHEKSCMTPEYILIVDPEPKRVSLVSSVLTTAGYAVSAAKKGEWAVLNRCQDRAVTPSQIICDDLVITPASRGVTLHGVEVYLTETEYNLLFELTAHRNQVLLHEQLLTAVWGAEFRNEPDYLHSYIHILRRKLESDPSQPRLIISRPGVGYMLVST